MSLSEIADILNRHQSRYGSGFYCSNGGRYFHARVTLGVLECSDFFTWTKTPEGASFFDSLGKTIAVVPGT